MDSMISPVQLSTREIRAGRKWRSYVFSIYPKLSVFPFRGKRC